MLTAIFIIYGLLLFVDALMDKWGLWFRIHEYGSNSESGFIYKLTNCKFCLRTHFSIIATIIYFSITGFTWDAIAVPFIVSGLWTLKP